MQIVRKSTFTPVAQTSRGARYVKGHSAFPKIAVEPKNTRRKPTQEPPPLEFDRFLTILRRMEEDSHCSLEDALGYSNMADFFQAAAETVKQARANIPSRPISASLVDAILILGSPRIEEEVTRRRGLLLASEALETLAREGHFRLAYDRHGAMRILSGDGMDEYEVEDIDEILVADDWLEEDEDLVLPTDEEALEAFTEALTQLPTAEDIRRPIKEMVIMITMADPVLVEDVPW